MCMLEIVLTKVVLQKDYNMHNTPLFETGCDFGAPPTPHSDLPWSQQNWSPTFRDFPILELSLPRGADPLAAHLTHQVYSPGPKAYPRHKFFEIEVTWDVEKRLRSAPAKEWF